MNPIQRFTLTLPRHAFGPRQVARAGEMWRLFQEVAVLASMGVGWPPSRYRAQGTGFVVGAMTVLHHRELMLDEEILARTWVHDFRRGTLTRRSAELRVGDVLVAEAIQSWVHVKEQDGDLVPARASNDLIAAFPPHPDPGPVVRLPHWESTQTDSIPDFDFELWHGWMDPLGHANHPAYIDWCDEALCRALASAGHDPTSLVAVGEQVRWREAAVARDRLVVRTRIQGRSDSGVVFLHELLNQRHGRTHATAVTIRRLVNDSNGQKLALALGVDEY